MSELEKKLENANIAFSPSKDTVMIKIDDEWKMYHSADSLSKLSSSTKAFIDIKNLETQLKDREERIKDLESKNK